MIHLQRIVNAWGERDFARVAKQQLEQLAPEQLPLQQGLTQSSYVKDAPVTVSILRASDTAGELRIKAGVFYTGLVPGCQCADDPSPMDEYNEYCELLFVIDRQTGEGRVTLVDEHS